MSRSVMDLKEVCLELCAGGILIKAMELVKLPNYQSLDPVEFLYECLVSEAARRQTRKVWNWDVGAEFRISIKKPELQGLRP